MFPKSSKLLAGPGAPAIAPSSAAPLSSKREKYSQSQGLDCCSRKRSFQGSGFSIIHLNSPSPTQKSGGKGHVVQGRNVPLRSPGKARTKSQTNMRPDTHPQGTFVRSLACPTGLDIIGDLLVAYVASINRPNLTDYKVKSSLLGAVHLQQNNAK